jgi:hypothetical protein
LRIKNKRRDSAHATIERRAFIKGVLAGAIATLSSKSVISIVDSLKNTTWRHWQITEEVHDLIFGELLSDFSIEAGYDHPKVSGIHPDNLAALTQVRNIIDPKCCDIIEFKDNVGRVNDEGNIICIGGPVSSRTSRAALEYELVRNQVGCIGISRSTKPKIELPFEYALEDVRSCESAYWLARTRHIVPNWSIKSNSPEMYVDPPELDRDRKLMSDYLLVTRIPNILNLNAFLAGKKILIIGGCHGIATRSLQSIVDDAEIQDRIRSGLGGAKHFQILIRMRVRHADRSQESEGYRYECVAALPLDEYMDRAQIIERLRDA